LTLTYLPPPDTEKKILRLFLERADVNLGSYDEVLTSFAATCDRIEDQLSSVLVLDRLDSVDLLSLMKRCITGIDQRMRIPVPPMYLDYHLAPSSIRVGLTPMVGRYHIRVVAITGFPAESSPAMLNQLSNLPLEYRWSVRFLPLDPPTAEARLRVVRRHWFQKRKGAMGLMREAAGDDPGPEDGDADHMSADASAALALASEGEVRFGYFTSVVVLFDEDVRLVDEGARAVLKAVHGLGFSGRIEDLNTVEAYLGSIPGHGFRNVRRPIMHTLNLADLIPSTSVWTGRRRSGR
jgi:type IV secretion system protein VirB4